MMRLQLRPRRILRQLDLTPPVVGLFGYRRGSATGTSLAYLCWAGDASTSKTSDSTPSQGADSAPCMIPTEPTTAGLFGHYAFTNTSPGKLRPLREPSDPADEA
ncbi:hypothetical protein GCM10027563_25470 [Parasphingorhabdus pacifica]